MKVALLVLIGLAAIIALACWIMAEGPRPAVVPVATALNAPEPTDEAGLRALLTNPAMLERGRLVYGGLCYTCHGAHGEGGLGPNLRDAHWLHGSQMMDILRVINDGTPGTSMQAMRHAYPASDRAAMTAYIVTLAGDGGKAAEGAHVPISYWPVR